MSKIFIGSSNEAKDQALKVAAHLEMQGAELILWTDAFEAGDITFLAIESVTDTIKAAVILATPDDTSIIRGKKCSVPRANVLFEYGYLTSRLSRSKVALCVYDKTTLPTDFNGLTVIPMGKYEEDKELTYSAKEKLTKWSKKIQASAPTDVMHGYSGKWKVRAIFSVWNGIKITKKDTAVFDGFAILNMNKDGTNGNGIIFGTTITRIGSCYAEFQITDQIIKAKIDNKGGLKIDSKIFSRDRIVLTGTPSQQDGYEERLRESQEMSSLLEANIQNGAIELRGIYKHRTGKRVVCDAVEVWEKEV